MWDNLKQSNINVIEVPRKENENGTEKKYSLISICKISFFSGCLQVFIFEFQQFDYGVCVCLYVSACVLYIYPDLSTQTSCLWSFINFRQLLTIISSNILTYLKKLRMK